MQDHRDGLVEELVQHPVAQQVVRESLLREGLLESDPQERRELVGVEIDVFSPAGVLAEVVGILQERVPDHWLHVRRPSRPRGPGQRCFSDLVEVGEVVVVIPTEQLVRGGTADRDAVALLGNRLHQPPVCVVADRENRGIVVAHQLAEATEKVGLLEADPGVTNVEFRHRVVDHLLFLIALILVDDGETVDVVVEDPLGDADQ